jgi:imidazolonepropionase
MHASPDTIWYNANVATMAADRKAYGLVRNGAVCVRQGVIEWVGPTDALPAETFDTAIERRDCRGGLVTPGLVDCHTHLVYAGNRAAEFEMRLRGASYEEVARAGGGIMSTVAATREADEDRLLEQCTPRLQSLLDNGVTTIEIKSGYGLDLETELKMLRVVRRLAEQSPADVRATFLGAHAVPPEYAGEPDAYIDLVCREMLPAVAHEGLAEAVDAFCEGVAFSPSQVERVFIAAEDLGLAVKCHAEQLSHLGGARLAARCGALSVDHLEYLDESDVPVLADYGTVAVLLPGAFYVLGETRLPPIEALRRHKVPMALASDSNPGTSPVLSLTLMLNMGCTLFRITPEEALAGVTREGARALGLVDEAGTIEPGKRADLALWRIHEPGELSYHVGGNPCEAVMFAGRTRLPC